jgi:hypothetical protein
MPTNINAFAPNSQDFSTSGSITIPIGLDTIVNWATNTGPRLSITTRAVLIAISRYANADGIAWPSHRTIADAIDAAGTSTIKVAIQHLTSLGLISVQQRPGAPGEPNQSNVYRLSGILNSWQPREKNARETGQLFAAYRLRIQDLVEDRLGSSLSDATATSNWGTGPDYTPADTQTPDAATESPIPPLTTAAPPAAAQPAQVPSQSPAPNDIDARVRKHWPDLGQSWKQGINTAINWYRKYPDELEAQISNVLAIKEHQTANRLPDYAGDQPRQYPPAPTPEQTWTEPPDADPEAKAMWNLVLEDIRKQLPEPTFTTWVKNSVGMARDGDVFIVAAPGLAAAWLQRRMFKDLESALYRTSGLNLMLDIRAANGHDQASHPAGDQNSVQPDADTSPPAYEHTPTAEG